MHACPFADYFALNIPDNAKILNTPSIKGSLTYTKLSDVFFQLSCGDSNFSSGDLTIDLGFDNDNKCNLVIHDGPYVISPTVTLVKCDGNFKYDGMEHVYGTYNYTLKFK